MAPEVSSLAPAVAVAKPACTLATVAFLASIPLRLPVWLARFALREALRALAQSQFLTDMLRGVCRRQGLVRGSGKRSPGPYLE